uniref:GCR102 n=1 Tax=Schmidtea mediterranea TaxID=79327 RepID=A0A193KUM4_SCHMD|nr:GCR102 [Schmidtea mediterranea]
MSKTAILEIIKFQFENANNENFSFASLSDNELLKFKRCVDECIQIMTEIKTGKSGGKNRAFGNWCNRSAQAWFHELYYVLWKRSPEVNVLKNVVEPYLVPIFLTWCIIQIAIMAILLLCFTQLRKSNSLWVFLFWYCLSSEAELVIVTLLFNIFANKFSTNFLCRSKQFISSTLSAIPHWILAEALFNQSLTSLRCSNLPPVAALGTKIIITCSVVAIVVLNAHSLWLYSVDQYENKCNIHLHSQALVFVIGYPIYLEIIENIIPGIVILACVFVLVYCIFKKVNPEENLVKTPLILGLNYLIFNVPCGIYWLVSNFTTPDSSLKPFNELKMTTIIKFVVDFFANQSNFFILPIVFGSSPIIRITTQKLLEKQVRRLREMLKPKIPDVNSLEIDLKTRTDIALPLVNNI